MQLSREVVVASIQVDLDEAVLERFEADLLQRVHEAGPRAVFLDVSGLETLDAHEFAALRRIGRSATIMGTEAVMVGLRPGVVSALVEMDADVEGLRTAIDIDAAFALIEPAPSADHAADGPAEPDDDFLASLEEPDEETEPAGRE